MRQPYVRTPASSTLIIWPVPVPGRTSVDQAERDRHRLRCSSSGGIVQRDLPETTFRLSLRTAPNQRPEEAQEALARFMVEHAPFGAEVWVDKLDNGMGWAMDPNAEATKDAMDAMEEAFGVAPVNKGEGGSIPFIPELQRIFPDAQVLVTGPEDPKANAHSPNESISLPSLKNNVITEALLLDKLAK